MKKRWVFLPLIIILAFAWIPVKAKEKEAYSMVNKDLVLGFYEDVLNRHDLGAVDKYLSDDFVDHSPDPGQAPGKEGVKQAFREFLRAFPDLRTKVEMTVVEDNRIAVYLTETGTQAGDFAGMPASGRKFKIMGIDIFQVKNGKCTDRWGCFDVKSMLDQLAPPKKDGGS